MHLYRNFILALALQILTQTAFAQPAALSLQKKKAIVESLSKELNDRYIFPETAKKTTVVLLNNLQTGVYENISDPLEFTDTLTAQIQRISADKHLRVRYRSPRNTPPPGMHPMPDRQPRQPPTHRPGPRDINEPSMINYKIIENNIAYLQLDEFTEGAAFNKSINDAFKAFQKTDALIIDLRNNHGGAPKSVQYVAGYFFNEPMELSSIIKRIDGKLQEDRFVTSVAAPAYLNKPVYILTSAKTFSAGEHFAYDMQSLKRAEIVGEITGGGANPGQEFPLSDNFYAFIPTGRSHSYITKTNWEGVGVQPDIFVDATSALEKVTDTLLKK